MDSRLGSYIPGDSSPILFVWGCISDWRLIGEAPSLSDGAALYYVYGLGTHRNFPEIPKLHDRMSRRTLFLIF